MASDKECGTLLEGSVICTNPDPPQCCYSAGISGEQETAFVSVCYIMAVLGSCTNLLTLTALPYARSKCMDDKSPLRGSLTILIIHLSFCDFLYSLFCVPILCLEVQNHGWPYGSSLCYIAAIIRHLPLYSSFFLVATIAINRCVALWSPRFSRIFFEWGYFPPSVFICWTVAILLMVPNMIPSLHVGVFGYNYKIGECNTIADKNETDFHGIAVIISQFLTFAIVLICSVLILVRVKISSFQFAKIKNVATFTIDQLQRREFRLTYTVLSMILLYICCIMPLALNTLGLYRVPVGGTIYMLLVLLYVCNFLGNFFIYAFWNSGYRQSFLLLFGSIIRKFDCRKDPYFQQRSRTCSAGSRTTDITTVE